LRCECAGEGRESESCNGTSHRGRTTVTRVMFAGRQFGKS
jgi:hypothetical protein